MPVVGLGATLMTAIVAVVVAVVLVGRSPVSAIGGALLGGGGGFILGEAFFLATAVVLERHGPGPGPARRVSTNVLSFLLIAIIVVPPVLAVVGSLVL